MTFPKTLTVEVLQDDIEKGVCTHPNRCAIANALARSWGYASVGSYSATVAKRVEDLEDNIVGVYELPREAHKFIKAFDNHEQVEPITFTATLSYAPAEAE